jgi:hypothetical protein
VEPVNGSKVEYHGYLVSPPLDKAAEKLPAIFMAVEDRLTTVISDIYYPEIDDKILFGEVVGEGVEAGPQNPAHKLGWFGA